MKSSFLTERPRARVFGVDLQHHGSRGCPGWHRHRRPQGHRRGLRRVRKGDLGFRGLEWGRGPDEPILTGKLALNFPQRAFDLDILVELLAKTLKLRAFQGH